VESAVPRFATRPDIVIQRGTKPLIILDTKWKRLRKSGDDGKQGVSQADVYQMMAYGQIYDVDRLILVYPHNQELDSIGVQSTHLIARTSNRHLTVATIDLSRFEGVGEQLVDLCDRSLACSSPS
jgi:5-methylcytosine-specific restriction enzyme subunit McrC